QHRDTRKQRLGLLPSVSRPRRSRLLRVHPSIHPRAEPSGAEGRHFPARSSLFVTAHSLPGPREQPRQSGRPDLNRPSPVLTTRALTRLGDSPKMLTNLLTLALILLRFSLI